MTYWYSTNNNALLLYITHNINMMWWQVGWLGDLLVQIIMLKSLLVDVQTVYLYAVLVSAARSQLFRPTNTFGEHIRNWGLL